MLEYHRLTEIGDPHERQFPLRRKYSGAATPEVPPLLDFMTTAKVLSKYPDLRDKLYQALKKEGVL